LELENWGEDINASLFHWTCFVASPLELENWGEDMPPYFTGPVLLFLIEISETVQVMVEPIEIIPFFGILF
jgi:hypothetical protein